MKRTFFFEIYNYNKLNSERLQRIIEFYAPILTTSFYLIKKLMKDNNEEILEILFKHHFDNFTIIDYLNYYKYKTQISDSKLYTKINNDKYKISTEVKKYYDNNINLDVVDREYHYYSSYYLFNACESGNKTAIKYLLEHGADINKENTLGETPLFIAYSKGNKNVVQYLVEKGAN